MLSKEEIEALSSCVGSAIGEFGASETTDLAIQAIRKLESGLTKRTPDGAYWCCSKCNSFCSVEFDTCGLCKSPRR